MSLALARKYRPTTFNDLIGQESISQTLSLALDTHRLSHAYLFSGLRGSGKTSTARIFAKALICQKGESSKPCGVCSNCKMADETRHIDIIEMDGASNRKIDDIRELIEHTKYKPAVARYKIFIIDEVHMLTKEAFNALLKTLEEPPSFIKFILATTDPLKLPATILSRTQHFRFKKIPTKTLELYLEKILNLEGIEYEKEAIAIIARFGAGSVRDALTLLDQAIVYSKNFVDVLTVTDMLGVIEPSTLKNLINSILAGDESFVLDFISKSDEYEAEMVINELMIYLKDSLLKGSIDNLTPLIIDKFFTILSEAKTLLSIGSDEEFILSLTLFKMINVLNRNNNIRKDISIKNTITNLNIPLTKPTRPKPKEIKKEKKIDVNREKFKQVIKNIYNSNDKLGECFERNIKYISYDNNILTWKSTATGEDRTLLKLNWGRVRMYIQELFGVDVKIKNVNKTVNKPKKEKKVEEEDIPIKNSSITLNNKDKELTKEKEDEKKILKHPMIAKVSELFSPKKILILKK